jgi:tellurite resistance protein TerC
MTPADLFPFSDYWWFYGSFSVFVLLLLAIDLGVFHRDARMVSFREAAVWSLFLVCLALAFNFGLYRYALWKFPQDPHLAAIPGFNPAEAAWQAAVEFLTGYIVEYALSADNIFVFVVIFGYFAIPSEYQHRVLFYGILGALAFRALFIALGSLLLRYEWVVLLFGVFLVLTGLKLMFAPERPIDPERNPVIRLLRRYLPVTPRFHDQRFFVWVNGVLHATPLFIALVFVELTDIVFAVDSVPAIFALTDEPLIVFTSNVFAILGLRATYFLLAGAVNVFHMLKYGLAAVLIFVGLKMAWLNQWYGGKFPIGISLGVISAVIATSILASLLLPRRRAASGT